jgi:hypothetical protein
VKGNLVIIPGAGTDAAKGMSEDQRQEAIAKALKPTSITTAAGFHDVESTEGLLSIWN